MQKPYSGWSSAPGSTKGANSVPSDPLADEEGAPAPLSLSALRDSLLAQNKRLSQGRRQVKICGVDRHGEREPITGVWRRNPQRGPGPTPLTPPPCNNSSDLYQFQERPLAKVGWTCPPQSSPPRGDATGLGPFQHDGLDLVMVVLETRVK